MDTREIIEHVMRGQWTAHNPRKRKGSPDFQAYANDALRRQKQMAGELDVLQAKLKAIELSAEDRKTVYSTLRLNSESYALARERDLMGRAIPLIEALHQEAWRLRRDRTRAFDFIGKIRDLELWGLGPVPEPSEDHWPETQVDDDLREPGGG